jgi:hypothetical protein
MTRRHVRRDPIVVLYERRDPFLRQCYRRCPPVLAPCEAAALDRIRAEIDALEMAEAAPVFARMEAECARLEAAVARVDAMVAAARESSGGPARAAEE